MPEPVTLTTQITTVTVFVQQARITRSGKITLPAGEHLVLLDNLPNTLEADSVRVSGRGVGVTLLSVDVKKEFVTKTTLAALETLKERQRGIEAQIEALRTRQGALQAQQEFQRVLSYRSGERLAHSLALGKLTIEQADALDTYFLTKSQQRLAKLSRVQRQLAQHETELGLVKTQLRQRETGQTEQLQIYQVRLAVRVAHEIEAEFDVDYLVQGASWKPFYDVRLLPDQRLELTYFADVTQRSGEDWQNVNLALSTARPAKAAILPELKTWFIDNAVTLRREQPVERMMMKAEMNYGAARRQEPATTEQAALRAPVSTTEYQAPPAETARATVKSNEQGGSLTYHIRTPTDIPSDGTPHKTTIAILTLSAKLDYFTIPKIAPEVHLRATITNTSEYTLLPGVISIFHGEDFIGKTQLALIAANEDFKVQLGIEERIKVERKLLNREVSKRFMGIGRRISYAYEIKVTNLLATVAKVTVCDQLPVSRHENILVQIGELLPMPQAMTELNLLTWTREIAAQANETLRFNFMVDEGYNTTVRGLEE